MMAKIVQGQGFGGVVNYILNPHKGAEILDSDGLMLDDPKTITESFNFQTELNPGISKPVGHISLNFSVQDQEKLSNRMMIQIAREYMNRMGIIDTQYLVGRHYDKQHPHVHLVFNRIDYNGKTISDRNERIRSAKICKELTREYNLYFAPGKGKVKENRLKEPDKTKYEIYHNLKDIVPHCQNWNQLVETLKDRGIKVSFKYKGKSYEKQGVIFEKNGFSYSGSKVDRQFSYSKISSKLDQQEMQYVKADDKTRQDQNRSHSATGHLVYDFLYQLQKQDLYRQNREKKINAPKIRNRKGLRR